MSSHYGPSGGGRDNDSGFRQQSRPFSGGAGGGGGRGSGGGGGRSSGGGRGRGGDVPPPAYSEKTEKTVQVYTNYFPMKFSENISNMNIFQYHVEIVPLKREYIKDENGEILRDERNNKRFQLVPVEGSNLYRDRKTGIVSDDESSNMTRAVLLQCQNDLFADSNKNIVTDGTSIVFALDELFTEGSTTPQPPKKKSKSDYYGPEGGLDEEKENDENAPGTAPAPYWDYNVKIANNDEDKEFKRKRDFIVRFTLSATLTFSAKDHRLIVAEEKNKQPIIQFLNILLKNAMMISMRTFDKKSNSFYPKLEDQKELMKSVLDLRGVPAGAIPIMGIRESAHMLASGELVLNANYCMQWATKKEKIFSIEGRRGSILGIDVGTGDLPISDETMGLIERELKKIQFHVEYFRGEKWVQMKREANWDEERIKKYEVFTKKGTVKMWKDPKNEIPSIKRTAMDHSFPCQQDGVEVQISVAEYYKGKGVALKYPNLPLVRVSDVEWFPIEFLVQAFGNKKVPNDENTIRCALTFNDTYTATERVFRTQKLVHPPGNEVGFKDLSESANNRNRLLQKVKLMVDFEPHKANANVLRYPNVRFGNKIMDGARWNTNNVIYEKPASLLSFAIVNLDHEGAFTNVGGLLKVCINHGMDVIDNVPLDVVTVHCRNHDRDSIISSVQAAIERAKRYFLYRTDRIPSYGYYFKTFVQTGDAFHQCLIEHSQIGLETKLAAIAKNDSGIFSSKAMPPNWTPSHEIQVEGREFYSRLKYRFRLRNNEFKISDIFDFKCLSSRHFRALDDNGHVHEFEDPPERVFQFERDGTWQYVDYNSENILRAMIEIDPETARIECPSVIFFIMPAKENRLHSSIKDVCRLEFGVQSQCFAMSTLKKQRNVDQYFSGIALKLNAKLSNVGQEVRSWKVESHPWVKEVPTFVMGYSISSAQGRQAGTVIAAAAILDSEGLTVSEDFGIQTKRSPIVEGTILQSLTKSLIMDYYDYGQGVIPKRVVIYRQGGTEGLFKDFKSGELQAIKSGIKDGLEALGKYDEQDPYCMPLVTFAIAQSRHGVQIVPADNPRNKRNVDSGTCVDIAIHQMQDLSLSEPEQESLQLLKSGRSNNCFPTARDIDGVFDFQLIPQEHMKGTSKPVHYRVIWNENYLVRVDNSSQLGRSEMENLTYGLSFQYGTATKPTRLMSVLYYADKLAQATVAYMDIIIPPQQEEGIDYLLPSYKEWMIEKNKPTTSFHLHQSA